MMPYKLREWILMDRLDWDTISYNSKAIDLLEANPDKIKWNELSRNPNAIHLLKANPGKINWTELSINPNIFTYDYEQMTKNKLNLNRELIEWFWNPERIQKYLEQGINLE
jgi:ribosomal protein L24E